MTATLESLKAQLQLLTKDERAELADFLLNSLPQEEREEEIAVAWSKEVRRRVEDYRSGKASGKPAEQVFAELRAERS